MNDASTPIPNAPPVPVEVASVLGSTLRRLLAESAFADAWMRPELAMDNDAVSQAQFHVLLPVESPWKGRILLSGDEATVRDLAAGFHSIPDSMVDRGIALEFLVELANRLLQDLFCATEDPVTVQDASELGLEQARELWDAACASRVALGCNEGRVFAALLAGA